MSNVAFRQRNRLSLCLPLRVTLKNRPVKLGSSSWRMNSETEYTVTENVGSGGCYFFLSQAPLLGARLEMEVTIPGDTPDITFARIFCRGKVVRVDSAVAEQSSEQAGFGVAATIEHLQDICVESIPTTSDHAARTSTGREESVCGTDAMGNELTS